jgi:hypothetical protein
MNSQGKECLSVLDLSQKSEELDWLLKEATWEEFWQATTELYGVTPWNYLRDKIEEYKHE